MTKPTLKEIAILEMQLKIELINKTFDIYSLENTLLQYNIPLDEIPKEQLIFDLKANQLNIPITKNIKLLISLIPLFLEYSDKYDRVKINDLMILTRE